MKTITEGDAKKIGLPWQNEIAKGVFLSFFTGFQGYAQDLRESEAERLRAKYYLYSIFPKRKEDIEKAWEEGVVVELWDYVSKYAAWPGEPIPEPPTKEEIEAGLKAWFEIEQEAKAERLKKRSENKQFWRGLYK